MVTINSIGSNIPIELSKGGTASTSFSTASGLVKYDGTNLVTSSSATLDASNRFTNTAQPAFLTTIAATRSNVTGDNTAYIIVWGSEVFDQGNNFDNVSTFTAPITGIYFFSLNVMFAGLTASHTLVKTQIITTQRAYGFNQNPVRLPSDECCIRVCTSANMDAGDTATVLFQVFNGTKVVDIINAGATDFRTYFSGYLIC